MEKDFQKRNRIMIEWKKTQASSWSDYSLENQVCNYMKRYQMLQKGNRVLAAVSGGADSICLLLVLKRLEPILGICVTAVTVNHGIRGEAADGDVEFVKKLCQKNKIPLYVHKVDVPSFAEKEKLSEEEAARRLRYYCFARTARQIQAAAVAVAHHKDDNCETILHNLFRGSSLRGIGGMNPDRTLCVSHQGKIYNLRVIRPFLDVRRKEIEKWLGDRGIEWRTDETNLQNAYTRNRIRNLLIPAIEKEINGQAVVHVVQAGTFIREAQELMEELAMKWIRKNGKILPGNTSVKINITSIMTEKPILRREILIQICRGLIGSDRFKDIRYAHLQMIDRLAEGATSRWIRLPGGIVVDKQYDWLLFRPIHPDKSRNLYVTFGIAGSSYISHDLAEERYMRMVGSKDESCMNEYRIPIREDGFHLEDPVKIQSELPEMAEKYSFRIFSYNGEKIPENNYTKWFDYDKIKDGLFLRTRCQGDYFLLDGGGKKTVKSYMIDRKIPASERDSMLLLAEGSHVLWLSDGRISAGYKIGKDTCRVLELKCKTDIK